MDKELKRLWNIVSMEGQIPELDIHMYDVIFKTIYLFLDTNNFQDTANTFLTEIKQKYKKEIDLNGTHARTLILRPFYDATKKDILEKDYQDNLIVDIPGDEQSRYVPLHQAKPLLGPAHALLLSSVSSICPDCTLIAKSQEKFEKFCEIAVHMTDVKEKSSVIDWNEIRLLGESIKSLEINHRKLIYVAQEISKSILQLKPEAKNFILNKYQQQIFDLYSYPGTHSTIDMVLEMEDNADDKTEYQVESSVINSSNNSNKSSPYSDLFIPLEGKKDVGDIPMLIANPKKQTLNGTLEAIAISAKYYDSNSTINGNSSMASECPSLDSPRHPETQLIELHSKRMNKSATLSSRKANLDLKERKNKSRSASFINSNQGLHQQFKENSGKQMNRCELLDCKDNGLDHILFIAEHAEVTNLAGSRSDDTVVVNYTKIVTDGTIGNRQSHKAKDNMGGVKEKSGKSKSKSNLNAIITINNEDKQEPINQNPSSGNKRPSHQTESPEENLHQPDYGSSGNVIANLDWPILKKTLFEGSANMKLKLLQALRWRLLKSEPVQREQHLIEYVKYDVLSINTIPPYGQLFLESFYCPKKMAMMHQLQEEMARFINTLASLAMGRLYLERDESLLSVMLLPLLMGKLPGLNIYQPTREFTMATVQKLSLSNKMREVIIAGGTIEWLIGFIEKNHRQLSNYEAEYSIALLTNLCINKEARNRCERMADRVVSVIIYLVDTPHKCCINYINPILYSLLLNPLINDKAVARGIGVKLKNLYTTFAEDEDLKKQLDAIIAMHETHDFCECDDCETEDLNSQTYTDYIEHELSQNEPIYESPIGEELLGTFHTTVEPQSVELHRTTSDLIKHVSLVQIVKKNCVCNNKSIGRLEQKLLEENNAKTRPQRMKNARQKPPTTSMPMATTLGERGAQRNVPEVPKVATFRNLKAIKNDKFVTSYQPKGKAVMRRRSVSQPPVTRLKPAARIEPTARRLDTIAPAAPKIKEYIVNCCYKMDYVNAIAASPGQFKPQPLEAIKMESRIELKNDCGCYDEMKKFVGDIDSSDGNRSESEMLEEKMFHNECHHQSVGNVAIKCENCKSSIPVKSLEKIGIKQSKPLRLTDYHAVFSGSNPQFVGRYESKGNKR